MPHLRKSARLKLAAAAALLVLLASSAVPAARAFRSWRRRVHIAALANAAPTSPAGGGVWKTWDFVSAAPNPTWHPITEGIGPLAVGALALDPNAPDTLYLGTGDPWDTKGALVFKSSDGGGSWSAGVP